MNPSPPARTRFLALVREKSHLGSVSVWLVWLPSAQDIIDVHAEVLQKGRGHRGVLQRGPIEAAVERARWGPFHAERLSERAAFLMRGIAADHPFVDGNKRTAYKVADLFLRQNGYEIDAEKEEIVGTMVDLAKGDLFFLDIQAWIERHMRKL